MSLALPVSAKLVVALAAFSGIGVVVLPADLSAVGDLKIAPSVVRKAPDSGVSPPSMEAPNRPIATVEPKPTPALEQPLVGAPATVSQTASVVTTGVTTFRQDHVNASVNVRASGQKDSPVLFVLAAGAEVRIAGAENGWSHVFSDHGEGWVYSEFIGDSKPTDQQDRPKSAVKTVRVAGSVRVYDAPGGNRLYRLEAGERIRIVETEGKWARIATSSGEGGWVRLK